MDQITLKALQGAAGAAGGGDPVYVEDVFNTDVYWGNGSTQPIVNGIDLDGKGGMVWFNRRNYAQWHLMFDTKRDVLEAIYSDQDRAEETQANSLTAFNNDGYSLGTLDWVNGSDSYSHSAWTFRKAPGFFDVVTYTGDRTNTPDKQEIPHSLGCIPGMVMIKKLDTGGGQHWEVYHKSTGNEKTLHLNSTNTIGGTTAWDDTTPNSTHFIVGPSDDVNEQDQNYVAYLFADGDDTDAQIFGDDGDEAIIKCGTYVGNDGINTIDLGFEPQWVMIKCATGASESWMMHDIMRGMTWEVDGRTLRANEAVPEGNGKLGVYANGFIVNETVGSYNYDGGSGVPYTYIYMAIRRGPMKTPEAGDATKVFTPVRPSSSGTLTATSGFVTDWSIVKSPLIGGATYAGTRLTGGGTLTPHSNVAEWTVGFSFDFMDKITIAGSGDYSTWIAWNFKRAPGFFDVVAYQANNNSAFSVNHNLGVAPEMVIIRNRDTNYHWSVSHTGLTGGTDFSRQLALNNDTSESHSAHHTGAPSATQFHLGTSSGVNWGTDKFIAYLFATVAGVSKVGSYTGTGNAINVDCGFTAGARFVLIKRTDATGDWYVWDTERGIIADDDPYLLMNEDDAEVTNTDYIDPHPENKGFRVTSSAPNALNDSASGSDYIYLAIA